MENVQNFIKNYFSLLNLKKMDPAIKSHFDKLVDKDDFPTKDAKDWVKFMDKSTKKWNDLPNFATLSDDELTILYRDLAKTLISMSSHTGSFDDKTKEFLESYYGENKLFNAPEIDSDTKNDIRELLKKLFPDGKNVDENMADFIPYDVDTTVLTDAINDPKLLDAPDVKSAVRTIVAKIKEYARQGWIDPEEQFKDININKIQQALYINIEPTNDDLEKLKIQAPEIFAKLFKEKKIFDAFKKYEPADKIISDQVDDALSYTDYTGKSNKDNYIAPKYTPGKKNPRQYLDATFKDWADALKKYQTMHRDNVFIKPTAKKIFETFDKKGIEIKTTDGLNAVIQKSGTILEKLRGNEPFTAAAHFEWMTNKLEKYQKYGLGNEIDGALRWGYQMNRIVTELIKDAVKEGKIEEAKTALEVLSVMQYGTFTSRTMNAINATDFTLFSDKGLSWNKNDTFVTDALDKKIKFGLQAAGYLATGIVNRVRKIGTSFNTNHSQELYKLYQEKENSLSNKRTEDEITKNNAINNYENAINALNGLTINNEADAEITRQEIKEHEKDIQDKTDFINAQEQILKDTEENYNKYNEYQKIIDDFNNIPDKIKDAKTEIKNIKKQVKKIQDIFENGTYINPITNKPMSAGEANHYEKTLASNMNTLREQFISKKSEIKDLENKQKDTTERDNAVKEQELLEHDYNEYKTAEDKLNTAETERNNLLHDKAYKEKEILLQEYSEAVKAKEKAENEKNLREKEWKQWNEKNKNGYHELMAYWDFLQTGKTKNLFRLSTKKLQAKMDKTGELQKMLTDYTNSYAV